MLRVDCVSFDNLMHNLGKNSVSHDLASLINFGSAVTQFSLMISCVNHDLVFADEFWISNDLVFIDDSLCQQRLGFVTNSGSVVT